VELVTGYSTVSGLEGLRIAIKSFIGGMKKMDSFISE
jgi:hypothetical protein